MKRQNYCQALCDDFQQDNALSTIVKIARLLDVLGGRTAVAKVRSRGGQTFPKSTEIRNSIAFRAVFSVFFRPKFSVWQNRFPSSFCSSHDVVTYWEANSG